MAVQAQYPSTLLNRNDQESKNMMVEYSILQTQTPTLTPPFLDQLSSPFFPIGGDSANTKKRGREPNPMAAPSDVCNHQYSSSNNLFSLQPQRHQEQEQVLRMSSPIPSSNFYSHWQQQQQPKSLVSTGLHLSFSDNANPTQKQKQQRTNLILLDDQDVDLTPQINFHNVEIDQLLHEQREKLRRVLEETQKRHHRALVSTIVSAAAKRMQEKAIELEVAVRRNKELEERVSRRKVEISTLQAKARADQSTAAALHAKLQQAAAERVMEVSEPAVSDSESACVDRMRKKVVFGSLGYGVCRQCWSTEATVVVLPCRHLCVCRNCDGSIGVCPVCSRVRSASVEVYLL